MRVKLVVVGSGEHTELASVGDCEGLRAIGEAFIEAADTGEGQSTTIPDVMTGEGIVWRVTPLPDCY